MNKPGQDISLVPGNMSRPVTPIDVSMRVIDSETIFGQVNENEIMIRHRGQLYRLRITRSGKLILTK